MSKFEKLLERMLTNPKDFTFEETETVLQHFGFHLSKKGKTSGSRIAFVNKKEGIQILLHKPHGRNHLLSYELKAIIRVLKEERFL